MQHDNTLCPAICMNERDAARYYYNIAKNWYHGENNKAFATLSKDIKRITNFLESTDKNARSDAIQTLSFIATCHKLHLQLFELGILTSMVHILGSSPNESNCEAALVILNHLCTQSPRYQKDKFDIITDFCKDKKSLSIIFKYAHVEDKYVSIIATVMSLIAALCTERPNIQEHCIRAGVMERAYNLKTSDKQCKDHLLYIVSGYIRNYVKLYVPNDIYPVICLFYPCNNVDLFLYSIHLDEYPVDKFNEMHDLLCIKMGYSSFALCLAIWRLIITSRIRCVEKINRLYTAVHQISVEDPTVDADWYVPDPTHSGHINSSHVMDQIECEGKQQIIQPPIDENNGKKLL